MIFPLLILLDSLKDGDNVRKQNNASSKDKRKRYLLMCKGESKIESDDKKIT